MGPAADLTRSWKARNTEEKLLSTADDGILVPPHGLACEKLRCYTVSFEVGLR